MKFRRPNRRENDLSPVRPVGKPQWLRDWIKDKSKWAKLACGHTEDLTSALLAVGRDVWCDQCGWLTSVEKPISEYEALGIQKTPQDDHPPF